MLLAAAGLFRPDIEEFFGLLILRIFASPFVLVMATFLTVWLHLRNAKASYQPLYPLQWNDDKKCFEEVTPSQ